MISKMWTITLGTYQQKKKNIYTVQADLNCCYIYDHSEKSLYYLAFDASLGNITSV